MNSAAVQRQILPTSRAENACGSPIAVSDISYDAAQSYGHTSSNRQAVEHRGKAETGLTAFSNQHVDGVRTTRAATLGQVAAPLSP
jgi:hypothetical protein